MSMQYDRASYMIPLAGTAAAVVMNGTNYTAVIDTQALQATSAAGKALTFVAAISALTAYSAAVWNIVESDDGVTYTAVPAAQVIVPLPANLALTSKVFHAGCVSKKRYVKAALTAGDGTPTGQITAIIEQLDVVPAFAS